MRRMFLVAVCFLMLGVSVVVESRSVAAGGGGGTATTMSGPGWCRNC